MCAKGTACCSRRITRTMNMSLGQVKTLEYSHYDINGYHFWMVKLEASHSLAATTNSGLVTSGEDATGHVTDYYDILQNIVSTHLVVLKS
jgi:hypothetical protein